MRLRSSGVNRLLLTMSVVMSGELAAMTQALATGSVNGTVIESIENSYGIDIALQDASGIQVQLTGPDGSVLSTATQNGAYSFGDLAPGEYQLTVHDRLGKTAAAAVSVADGLVTIANALLIPSKSAGVFIYYAAMGIEVSGADNPDVDRDGIVRNADLNAVVQSVGQNANESLMDVNRDGVINQRDVNAVRTAFGKVVLTIGAHYQAQVTAGGSVAVIGDGLAFVRSEQGSSTGVVTWAPPVVPASVAVSARGADVTSNRAAAQPAIRNTIRFQITEDVGVASSPEIGLFSFAHNPDDLTWIDVSLQTGRVRSGRIGLLLDGEAFGKPLPISGSVSDGLIAFAPGGFSLYHVVNVAGKLPPDFPGYPNEAFVMEKCEPAKKNKDCLSQMVTGGACTWPITGNSGTCSIGFKCSTEDADCVVGGQCKKCDTQCTATGGGTMCGCWCL